MGFVIQKITWKKSIELVIQLFDLEFYKRILIRGQEKTFPKICLTKIKVFLGDNRNNPKVDVVK